MGVVLGLLGEGPAVVVGEGCPVGPSVVVAVGELLMVGRLLG